MLWCGGGDRPCPNTPPWNQFRAKSLSQLNLTQVKMRLPQRGNCFAPEADRFMLRKAQAAALLHWRGHHVPNS
ncbi:MAG: hypothetical protein HC878_12860 [Leptolyngbyaceae cyanobacterium SL_5_14]|nr:hypothetical protein [Leptolyngbyaceae cyanobacterium SL_5_14]